MKQGSTLRVTLELGQPVHPLRLLNLPFSQSGLPLGQPRRRRAQLPSRARLAFLGTVPPLTSLGQLAMRALDPAASWKLGGPLLHLGLPLRFLPASRLQGVKQVPLAGIFSVQGRLKPIQVSRQGLQPLLHLLGAAARVESQHLFHFLHRRSQALGRLSRATLRVALATQQQASTRAARQRGDGRLKA